MLRLWAIGAEPLWLDEAFSVWVAAHNMPDLVRFVASVDHHPPLYYLLLHGWQRAFGDAQATVRLLSALLGVAAIPLFYFGGRILVGRRAAWIAALLLAVSPFHVRYGQEARMYALMTFLAAAMLWSLAVYLADSRSRTRRRRVAMAVLALSQAALMLTHNTAAFLVPIALNIGVLIPWLWRGREGAGLSTVREKRFLRGWLMVQGAALLLWLPWLPSFAHQARVVYADFWIDPLSPYFVWLTFHNFNLAFPDGWFPGSPWWDLLFWSLAVAGVYALRRCPPVAFLLAVLFLGPALVEIVISLARPVLYDRTLIWTTLPYYLLIGNGLDWLAGATHAPARAPAQPRTDGRRAVCRCGSVDRFGNLAPVLLCGLQERGLAGGCRLRGRARRPGGSPAVQRRLGRDSVLILRNRSLRSPAAIWAARPEIRARRTGVTHGACGSCPPARAGRGP